MSKLAQDIILKHVITEDSMERLPSGRYTFEVATDANKVEIKKAGEQRVDVKVAKGNTISVKGKEKRMGRYTGYRADRKKAIVTLKGDKTIEFFDGMY